VIDIGCVFVSVGRLFSREFAGVIDPVSKAICGRDGFTRDFCRGGCENLSGAISWLTFSRAEQLTRGELRGTEPRRQGGRAKLQDGGWAICFQRKPRSFRCSAQSTGSRGVKRINVWAVSCGGFRPLMMAVVMSGASLDGSPPASRKQRKASKP
jgi:hypothetical protein